MNEKEHETHVALYWYPNYNKETHTLTIKNNTIHYCHTGTIEELTPALNQLYKNVTSHKINATPIIKLFQYRPEDENNLTELMYRAEKHFTQQATDMDNTAKAIAERKKETGEEEESLF